jgi:hypothetical protein
MKKSLLLVGVSVLSIAQIHAQQNPFNLHNERSKNKAVIQSILKNQFTNNTAQKPTGLQQRVIAEAITTFDGGTELDSLKYTYTGTNGSRYNYNQIGYPETFDPTYAPMYFDHRYGVDPLNLVADSIINYSEGDLNGMERSFYRPDKKIDSVHSHYDEGTGPFSHIKTLMHYTAPGVVNAKYTLQTFDNGISFDTLGYSKYYYNAANTRINADSFFSNTSPVSSSNKYIYNTASSRLDTIINILVYMGNEQKSRELFDYYNDGKLRKVTQQYFENAEWVTDGYDSLGYTGALDYVTYWQQASVYFDGTDTIKEFYLQEQYPGANGRPDSVWQYEWDAQNTEWVPLLKFTYEYNSFNNPIKFTAVSVESGPPVTLGYMDFYYETYEDGVSGINPIANNKDFNVYPNPFSNDINIDWKGKQQSNATIRLTNIVGQEVYKTSMKLTTGKNSVSIPSLNSGNYILLIQDADGKSWSSKMVKK